MLTYVSLETTHTNTVTSKEDTQTLNHVQKFDPVLHYKAPVTTVLRRLTSRSKLVGTNTYRLVREQQIGR